MARQDPEFNQIQIIFNQIQIILDEIEIILNQIQISIIKDKIPKFFRKFQQFKDFTITNSNTIT